jgi:hypothetical protein
MRRLVLRWRLPGSSSSSDSPFVLGLVAVQPKTAAAAVPSYPLAAASMPSFSSPSSAAGADATWVIDPAFSVSHAKIREWVIACDRGTAAKEPSVLIALGELAAIAGVSLDLGVDCDRLFQMCVRSAVVAAAERSWWGSRTPRLLTLPPYAAHVRVGLDRDPLSLADVNAPPFGADWDGDDMYLQCAPFSSSSASSLPSLSPSPPPPPLTSPPPLR